MQDVEIIGMLKSYVNQTLIGMGALKGAPCQIQSIVENPTGVWTITFLWEDENGDSHTSDLVLHDGAAASDYESLANLPEINNVQLIGNKSFADLGLGTAAEADKTSSVTEDSTDVLTSGGAFTALAGKVDKETGKGLSTNDFTTALKNKLDGIPTLGTAAEANTTSSVTESSTDVLTSGGAFTALAGKVDKEAGKGLSANDFTDALKNKLDGIEAGADVNTIETVKVNGTALTPDGSKAANVEAVTSLSVNGVAQTVTNGACDLDVATNLITETQWTAIQALLA